LAHRASAPPQSLSSHWPIPEIFSMEDAQQLETSYDVFLKNCSLEAEKATLSAEVVSLRHDSTSQVTEIERLKQDYKSLSSMMLSAVAENGTLKARLSEAESALNDENSQMRSQIDKYKFIITHLQSTLAHYTKKLELLEMECDSLAGQNAALWTDLEIFRAQKNVKDVTASPPSQNTASLTASPTDDPDIEFLRAQLKKVQADKADLAQAYAELQR